MVMFTGLWNPSNYIQGLNNDNDDEEDERRRTRNHERQSLRGGHQQQQQQQHPLCSSPSSSTASERFVPRTIEYGSIFERAVSPENTNDDNDKTVTWDDETLFSKNDGHDNNNNNNNNNNEDNNEEDGGSHNNGSTTPASEQGDQMSTGTSSSGEQALPSLTGAFQNLENRQIIMNCLFYLAVYMTIAVIAYSFVFEKWTIIDSLYFAVATFTTCGYGDLEPTTVPGQLFTIVFAIYGVVILGVFIAIFGSFISEYQTKAMRRFQRKKQSQMMETLFKPPAEGSERNVSGAGDDPTKKKKKYDDDTEDDEILLQESGFWRDHVSLADDVWRVVRAEAPLIGLVAFMSLLLGIREDWGFTSTMYFCIMAATTTGYGDYTPTNQLDKLYCVILLPLAVAVFGEVLGRIATVYIQRKQRVAQSKFLHRSLTLCDIRNMDTNEDGKVDREDFITFMLVALQKVDRSTIDQLKSIFDSLDTNGNGLLEEDDLVELAEENYLPTLQRIREEMSTRAEVDEALLRDLSEEPVLLPPEIQKHRRVHTVL